MADTTRGGDLPATMRALVVGHGPGWELVERKLPRPGAGEVLVRVEASASNNGDLPMLAAADPTSGGSGKEQVAGFEFAGHIAEVGEGVEAWSVGDEVMGSMPGTHADFVVVDARFLMSRPAGLTADRACVLPVGLLTEHGALAVAGFTPGRSVLVTGASSGVGLVGVQVAKALGASRVIGTTRRDSLRPVLTGLGVDDVVVTSGDDLTDKVLELTDGAGVDIVLDHLGEPTFAACLPATAVDGHLVPVGRAAGSKARVDLDEVGYRHLTIHGVSFGFTRTQEMADVVAGLRPEVLPAVARGDIRPVVDSTHPVTEHHRVIERLRSGDAVGKVVITFSS